MRVALVYDRLNKIGGAERILVELGKQFPNAIWYTSTWDKTGAPYSRSFQVKSSFLSSVPYFRRHHEYFPFLMPFIFESFDFGNYDLVISVGSAECKGIITKPKTRHIHYCLTPTRYLWSHKDEYFKNKSRLSLWIADILTKWDLVAAARPDMMISISEQVKNRVYKYYKRNSEVVYPPVDLKTFANNKYRKRKPYYLTVARLVPYKNIDLIIKAFSDLDAELIVVGDGSERAKLKRLAGENVKFRRLVSDLELAKLYSHAQAFIQANVEDFGIAMVESLAAGTPVIAYHQGGAKEIVTQKSGILYNELSVASLRQAVRRFKSSDYNPADCLNRAQNFSHDNWYAKFVKIGAI